MEEDRARRHLRFCFLEHPEDDIRICEASVRTYQELERFLFSAGEKKKSQFDLHIHFQKGCSGGNEVGEADYDERLRISRLFSEWELVNFVCFVPKRPYLLPSPGDIFPNLPPSDDLLFFIPSPYSPRALADYKDLQLPKKQLQLVFRDHWDTKPIARLSKHRCQALEKDLSTAMDKLLANLTLGKSRDENDETGSIVVRDFLSSYKIRPDGIQRI